MVPSASHGASRPTTLVNLPELSPAICFCPNNHTECATLPIAMIDGVGFQCRSSPLFFDFWAATAEPPSPNQYRANPATAEPTLNDSDDLSRPLTAPSSLGSVHTRLHILPRIHDRCGGAPAWPVEATRKTMHREAYLGHLPRPLRKKDFPNGFEAASTSCTVACAGVKSWLSQGFGIALCNGAHAGNAINTHLSRLPWDDPRLSGIVGTEKLSTL